MVDALPLIARAAGVSKRYGEVDALCDVDLAIPEGGIFGVIGTNGAGKTTLMRLLQGREVPDCGRVQLLGREARRLTRADRAQLGVQLEKGGLPPHLKTREVLVWLRSLYSVGEDPDALLEAMGLTGCAAQRVRDLSTGQHRLLAVTAALIGTPRLVFLDEPSLGLDPVARRRLWQVLRDAARNGSTLLLCTNLMEEAEALCQRVALLRRGRLLEEATPRDLIARYRSTHRIEFDDEITEGLLSAVQGAGGVIAVLRENAAHTVVSSDPLATLGALSTLGTHPVRLPHFRWVPPRLEDVFHQLEDDH